MTLDSDGLNWIRKFFPKGFYPKKENYEEDNAVWPRELDYSKTFIQDTSIYLRGIPMSYILQDDEYREEDDEEISTDISDNVKITNNSDLVKMNTCEDIMKKLLSHTRKVLNSENNIETVILRMDLSGKTPKAKYVGYDKRYGNISEFKIPEEVDLDKVFTDDTILPCSINSIFKNYKAKKLFYIYMTDYIIRKFKDIPPGKRLILDGGITEFENDSPLQPIIVYNAGTYQDGYIIQTDRMDSEYYLSHIGEADIGMIFWCNKLNNPPNIIMSEDGDLIVISLLRCRKRLNDNGEFDNNKIFIRKKKVIGKQKHESHIILRKQELRNRMEPDNKKKVRDFKLIKQTEYIDIDELYNNIINNNVWYGGEYLSDMKQKGRLISSCLNPVETLCTLLFMAGNDYVKRLPNVGFTKLWSIFTENIQSHKLGYMILVEKTDIRPIINQDDIETEDEMDIDIEENISVHKYGVHRALFESFVLLLLDKAFPRCKNKHEWTLDSFTSVYEETYKNAKRKIDLPTIGDIRGMAANISWCLAYFGNAYVKGHQYAYSLSKTKDDYDKYGYKLIDPNKSPLYGNITFSGNVKEKNVYWCY